MSRINYVIAIFAMIATTGCGAWQEEVPPGFVGMLKTHAGVDGEPLPVGNHMCYGRDRLILVETKEKVSFESKMQIRCADRMNITLDLKVRHRIKRDKKSILAALKAKGSAIKWGFRGKKAVGVLRYKPVGKTFVDHQAREITRLMVSKYATDQVRVNRAKIKKAVFDALKIRIKGSPVEVLEVMISNIDPPKVISDAIVKAKRREVEVQEEKEKQKKKVLMEMNRQKLKMMAEQNNQAMKTLMIKNKLALAQINKAVKAVEAEAEGIRMRVLGKYANAAYFRLLHLENQRLLYSHVGSKVIVTNGGRVAPIIGAVR